tara:strand:- start:67 stop:210 length:144 start_codon:yes stop_codon:yes gene_type:complete
MKHWKKFFLKYFDWNDDGVTNWWEYFIPIGIILLVEIIAEIIANWLI